MKKCFVSMAVLATLSGLRPAYSTQIGTTDDASAFIRGGSPSTFVNSGYAGSAGDGEVARDYIKFVLPTVANTYVTSATLLLSYRSPYNAASFPLSLYETTNLWSQDTITWSNQPGLGSALATFTPTNPSTISIDITNDANNAYLDGGTVSLVVAATNEYFTNATPDSWYYFSGGAEQLSYTLASNVPEPASIMLLSASIAGLVLGRRKVF